MGGSASYIWILNIKNTYISLHIAHNNIYI